VEIAVTARQHCWSYTGALLYEMYLIFAHEHLTCINEIFITEALELILKWADVSFSQSFAKIVVDEYNPPSEIGTRKGYWQNKW
jgi:hypothetical protein